MDQKNTNRSRLGKNIAILVAGAAAGIALQDAIIAAAGYNPYRPMPNRTGLADNSWQPEQIEIVKAPLHPLGEKYLMLRVNEGLYGIQSANGRAVGLKELTF